VNHDWSFENAYAWSCDGSIPPYYGAWEEAFDLGPGVVECGAYWFTQIGYFPSLPMDAYVWQGGAGGCPWTCIAPGIGYPTGWQHPSVVFPHCRSLGIGVYFGDPPLSGECRSWGAIRALFREH
jgi:hypothetical protein